jgi:hypothetical protein
MSVACSLAPGRRSNDFSRLNDAEHILESLKAFKYAVIGSMPSNFDIVAGSDGIFASWMDAFLQTQDSFVYQGKPNLVEIGYHYTSQDNIYDVQHSGMRCSKGRRHFFGRGIYVGNNPHAFRSYGNTGLVVLVTKGVQRWCLHDDKEESYDALDVDTFSGNKVFDTMDKSHFTRSAYFDEIVLRSDGQVIPLFRYSQELANNADLMWRFQVALQSWIDSIFRPGFPPTPLIRPMPCFDDVRYEHMLNSKFAQNKPTPFLVRNTTTRFIFGQGLPSTSSRQFPLQMDICCPTSLKAETGDYFVYCCPQPNDDCPICFDCLQTDTVALASCNHCFHKTCLQEALKHKMQCPICREKVGEPIGACPFGWMKVDLKNNRRCSGFPNVPTYVIKYTILGGLQTEEHENPGSLFLGTKRMAYIPATEDGRNLIKRLRYAFRRGLTFHVGTSLTSRRSNTVCWASIHHKTSTTEEFAFGWPDPRYFDNVNCELDQLKVPEAGNLL